jgi:hypothetical protein
LEEKFLDPHSHCLEQQLRVGPVRCQKNLAKGIGVDEGLEHLKISFRIISQLVDYEIRALRVAGTSNPQPRIGLNDLLQLLPYLSVSYLHMN